MKIVEKRSSITSNIAGDQFQIDNSPFMFDILSKNLYSDPVTSVLRELSCNAYDSHVANGNADKPFDIVLPNHFNSEFSIRDYGTGMSPEKIKEVYIVLGRSDKRDDNSAIGCFGLGSKSCWSITDMFTVESWYEGKHYIYSMHKDEAGVPTCSLLSEKDSTEPSGLKITIKNLKDAYSWKRSAQNTFNYFKVKPKINSSDKINFDNLTYILKGEGWGIKQSGGSNVIMGQVSYPLSGDIRNYISDNTLLNLINHNIDLFFEIGELSITPSRESIKYDKRTVLHIKSALEKISKEIKDNAEKEINSCKNYYQACKKYIDISSSRLFSSYKFNYKGKDFKEDIDFKNFGLSYRYGQVAAINLYNLTSYVFYLCDCKNAISRLKYSNAFYIAIPEDKKDDFIKLIDCEESDIKLASSLPEPPKVERTKTYKVGVYKNGYFDDETVDPTTGGYYIETYRYAAYYNKETFHIDDLNTILKYLESKNIKIDKLIGVKKYVSEKFIKKGNWKNIVDEFKDILKKENKTKILTCTQDPNRYIESTNAVKLANLNIGKIYKECVDLYKKNTIYVDLQRIVNKYKFGINIQVDNLSEKLSKEVGKYSLVDFRYRSLTPHALKYIEAVDKGLL